MNIEIKILTHDLEIPSNKINNVDEYLLKMLKEGIEGYCISEGYIITILEIISKSQPIINLNNFEGKINIKINYKAEVAKLKTGDIIVGCKVKKVANLGIFLDKDNYILIFIPKENYTTEHKEFSEGEIYNIETINVKMMMGQKNIEVIGKINYYKQIPEFKRLLKLPINNDTILKLNSELTNIKSNIKNECEFGYNPNIDIIRKQINEIDKDLFDYYKKLLNPLQSVEQLTYTEILNKYSEIKTTKTLLLSSEKIQLKNINPKIITNTLKLTKDLKSEYTLIIGNQENELDLNKIKYSEILYGLKYNSIGGSLIIKLSDICTELIIDSIYLIYQHYTNCILYKPESSPQYEPDRYLIALNYKGIDNKLLDELNNLLSSSENYIKKLYPLNKINSDFRLFIKVYNEQLFDIYLQKLLEIIQYIYFNNNKKPLSNEIKIRLEIQDKLTKTFLNSLK